MARDEGPGSVHPLRVLLDPKSVAIIGASDDPGRIGGRPLRYMLDAGFAGPIYPVNPRREQVQGLKAYPSIDDVPGSVDCAVIAVPMNAVVDAVDRCGAKGVKAAVIFSAGFAEMGEEGAAEQLRLADVAARRGIRVLGPNCLGTFNAETGFIATFSSSVEKLAPRPGPIAIASQSGAYGSHLFSIARLRGIDTRYWITTGNESDIQLPECIDYLVEDPGVRVICAYAEGVRDGPALRAALAKARDKGKPIVFMKVGRSEIGAEAVGSHTAALAGADAIYDALFRQYGVFRASTTDEMLDIAYVARDGRFPAGDKIGLLTISGGVGVQMADAASDLGLDVSEMPEPAQQKIRDALPFAVARNPVDVTGQALNQMEIVPSSLLVMLEEGGYDAVIAFVTMVAGSRYFADTLIDTLGAFRKDWPDRLIVLSIIVGEDLAGVYEDAGYPIFEDPTRAVVAAGAAMRFGQTFARQVLPPPSGADMPDVPDVAVAEHEAMRILAEAGLPVSRQTLVNAPEEAVAAAEALGGSVVMKVASPDIAHKTEIGGVIVGVSGEEAVRDAYETLVDRARHERPSARLDGILVAEMISGGVEAVIGVTDDPVFGPVVMVGLGGILVEVLEDVSFRLAPFGLDEAHAMIREIKGYKVLEGVRGAPPADIDALAQALVTLSAFAAKNAGRLETVDVNPFIVKPKGEGAVALDALILPKTTS